ncbi:hypothetical protein [Cryobacterium adonitolivorans]|uniref:hypothetical protein n=1 Tax=Cryobacterium adonitolivorans TaxID=1259189 RepID=UPI00141BB8E5|nr:hypothetical protein [Cryobacterium adonitolivorans]
MIAGFGAIAAGTRLHAGVLGAVVLTLLFAGSIAFTESTSVSRHPGHLAYRRGISALVPWPTRRPATSPKGTPAADAPVRTGGP